MSFEMNKIAGAILGAMILAMVSGIIASMLVRPVRLEKPVYMVAAAAPAAKAPAGGAPGAKPGGEKGGGGLAALLASADIAAGKEQAKKCAACHTFDKGQPNRIGPNLFDVVDGPIAEDRNGYSFSGALSAHKGQKWTLEALDQWLTSPRGFAPGTKMTFAGIANPKDRADVIAYLNSLSDHPKPLTASK